MPTSLAVKPSPEPTALPQMQRSRGTGSLSVKLLEGHTRIAKLHQQGCAKIRLPRVHNSAGAQAVLINSSGGMTGGDILDWQFNLQSGAHLTLTTQACERVYKSTGDDARTRIAIRAEHNTRLAWLPQETILFDHGRFARSLDADIAATCEALFVETIIFGRKAMQEVVNSGRVHDRWRIRHGGRLIHAEDFHVQGNIDTSLAHQCVAGGNSALATILLIAPRAEGLLASARQIIGHSQGITGDASYWDGKLLARVMASDSYDLRKCLVPLINLLNGQASLPKIWSL